MLKLGVLLFSIWCGQNLYAQTQSETFVVRSFDRHIEVLAPRAFHPDQAVIIENRTLDRLIGRLETADKKQSKHVAIEPRSSKSINISSRGQEYLRFIPLSPPFQEVQLRVGQESYEIPPKR